MTVTVEAPTWGRVQTGYRALAVAQLPNGQSVLLGSLRAKSPRLAMRWLRERAGHVADQVDAPYARPLRSWLIDGLEHQWALDGLARGESYVFRVRDEEGALYVLTAEPATVSVVPRRHQVNGKKA